MQFWSKAIIVIQMLIIDCHAHIYSFDEKKYPPRANPFRPPKWVGSVEHLHHVSQAAGVSAVRAIQTVTFYGYDNSYLIDSTRDHRDWILRLAPVHEIAGAEDAEKDTRDEGVHKLQYR